MSGYGDHISSGGIVIDEEFEQILRVEVSDLTNLSAFLLKLGF